MPRLLTLALVLIGLLPTAFAQPADPPQVWYPLDAETDGVYGLSINRAYEALTDREPQRTVVVAVIDSGVDIEHEDFDGRIWTNTDEVAGNGLDDDGNGYADDVHGWNFIGGADGRNVEHDTFELAREVASLRRQLEGKDVTALDREDAETYARLQELEGELQAERAEMEQVVQTLESINPLVQRADATIKRHLMMDAYTAEDLESIVSAPAEVQQARDMLLYLAGNGLTASDVADQLDYVKVRLDYGLNPDFDPRDLVGDDYYDPAARFYGNPDVHGPDPSHGTSVAGVIGAVRGNNLGIDGLAPRVLIMPIRAVPNGDERDKDVANAIRYAVDNGAHIINMSFGKAYSPYKSVVDEAVRYAEEHGVLLVHASGNDGADIDTASNFPNAVVGEGLMASNWIEVGASRWDDALAASFSNYGQTRVDVFAPGESIYSLDLDNAYGSHDGTSLAAPLVSGVAAFLMSYFPDLTAAQVRTVILESATVYSQEVPRPGGEGETASFEALSVTGGIVNAYKAAEIASQVAN